MSTIDVSQLTVANTVYANTIASTSDLGRIANSSFITLGNTGGITLSNWSPPVSINKTGYTGLGIFEELSVAYGNSTFVAVDRYSNGTLTSTDGLNWTARNNLSHPDTATPGIITCVTYGNGIFAAAGSNGFFSYSMDNGVTWTYLQETTLYMNTYAIAYGPSYSPITAVFRLVGGYASKGNPDVSQMAYFQYSLGTMGQNSLASTDHVIYRSVASNGQTPATFAVSDSTGMTYANGYFVKTYGDTGVQYSTDGTTWTFSQNTGNTAINNLNGSQGYGPGLAYGNGVFVSSLHEYITEIGFLITPIDPGAVITSDRLNANSWTVGTKIFCNRGLSWMRGESIAYGNGRFVIGGLRVMGYQDSSNIPPLITSNTFVSSRPGISTSNTSSSLNLNDGVSYRSISATPSIDEITVNGNSFSGAFDTLSVTGELCNVQIFTANGTWVMPYSALGTSSLVFVHMWGGGGGGVDKADSVGGGGGGAYVYGIYRAFEDLSWSNAAVVVGVAGALGISANGVAGGNSSFTPVVTGVSLTAYGGAGAITTNYGAGGGGGWLGAGNPAGAGGAPWETPYDNILGGGAGATTATSISYSSVYGGGGGGGGNTTLGMDGGSSIFGGGGGAGRNNTAGVTGNGGISIYGGRGANSTVAAATPGGGGSYNRAGARGEVRVYTLRKLG